MQFLVTLSELRDVFIIVYGVLGIIFFVVATAVALVVGLTVKGLVQNLMGVIDESIKPAVSSLKETADTVRGTADFVSRNAASPIVKTYGTFAGVKRGMGILSGLNSRRKGR